MRDTVELAVPLGTPLGLLQWKRGSSRPRSGAHPEAGLRFRRPDWSLPGDCSREIPEKHPTPRTKQQAGCLVGPQLQGKGCPHGVGVGGRFTPDGLRSGGEWAPRPERPRPCGEAWKRRGDACQAPHEAGPRFPASLAGGFAPRLCSRIRVRSLGWELRAHRLPKIFKKKSSRLISQAPASRPSSQYLRTRQHSHQRLPVPTTPTFAEPGTRLNKIGRASCRERV